MDLVIAAVGLLALILILAFLGLMREVTVLQSKVAGFTDLLLKPPAPKFFDGILPDKVRSRLVDIGLDQLPESPYLIFVRQTCSGCASLLQELKDSILGGAANPQQYVCVIGESDARGSLAKAVGSAGIPVLVDREQLIVQGCQVKQTPTIIQLAPGSLKVLDSSVGGNFEWMRSRQAALATDPAV